MAEHCYGECLKITLYAECHYIDRRYGEGSGVSTGV
jgi:hypothetical protein